MADTAIVNGVHGYTEEEAYIVPNNVEVRQHLEWFSGLKLGFMMHWAPVTQIGTMESWPLCDGDSVWSQQEIDWTDDMEEFKQQYWGLNKTFNPIKFRPDKWAALAKECGFKYLLFTTKHHDGFCMYDSAYTDYKITAPDCPFSTNPRADIVQNLFEAFRAEGMGISAYFSKPDWHSDAYWHKAFGAAPDRNVNYDISKHPKLWEEFVQYTQAQLVEITSNYGKIDTLWLDGGWVRSDNQGQDIRLGEVVESIRSTTQPHLIVCDRTVGGPYENIITPEQNIPTHPISVPWETCMTMGNDFSFHYNDEIKSAYEIIHLFLEIVSKGGSLALNVTPQPDGDLPQKAVHTMRQMGGWLAKNGEGIYNSSISSCTSTKDICYTQKDGIEHAFFLYKEVPFLPSYITLEVKGRVMQVRLLRTGETLSFEQHGEWIRVDTRMTDRVGMEYADTFAVEYDTKA